MYSERSYVILAGVNGAGKSTLFSIIPSLHEMNKVNLDDTVRKTGDWRNPRDVISAERMVIHQIRDYFDQGISFRPKWVHGLQIL